MSSKSLFLIGPGFIGGSLLLRLQQARPDLQLSALTRRDDQAKELEELGIKAIKGSLDDAEIISKYAGQADIVIHAATADHLPSAKAAIEGIKNRVDKSKKVVFIHTSGNDELVNASKGMASATTKEKTLSDIKGDEYLEKRIQPDAFHRQVDGPVREMIANDEEEKKHNVSTTIMMPPLIYGIGSKPWNRISSQTPMLTRTMMEKGIVALPSDFTGQWTSVWVHDLVEAYIILIKELEAHEPGSPQSSHYLFPAESETFLWKDVLDAIASQLKKAGHPSAKSEPVVLNEQSFYEFIGGDGNAYSGAFQQVFFGKENAYTSPDRLTKHGFRHKGKGVVDSIVNGKELEKMIADNLTK